MADKNSENLHAMRHSLAHIMATAITRLWTDVKLGVGPVVENGFYYDIDLGGKTISEEDFSRIEKEMQNIVKEDQSFKQFDRSIDEAIAWAEENNQPYKVELLNDLKREGTTAARDLDAEELGSIAQEGSKVNNVSFYENGEFIDLCRGPHVASTGKVGAFKLMRVAGAYWRGNEENPQMQRLYGVAFETQEQLDQHLEKLQLAEERDHRKLGRELDLFTFSDLVGSGLPLFTAKGAWLRELLGRYTQQLREQYGFERVWTPHMTKNDLYKRSGHWDKFGDELFIVTSQETTDELVLKPMNCPHHVQIYASKQRSYRDLPVRFMENTTDYRDEKSGELHGLSRVRSLTQDDSHVFCAEEQIEQEVTQLVHAAQEMYSQLDMELSFRLSFRDDSEGYLGDRELWDNAQNTLRELAKKNSLNYYEEEGEAAFYGPKIDFMAHDAIGREWQVATVQLDFVQPARFELSYVDESGEPAQPVMIHCALLGTIERFLSVYIEHTGGRFPLWLSPEQVRILPVNDKVDDYVTTIKSKLSDVVLMNPLKYNELRVGVDNRSESLGKRIRTAEEEKVPVIAVVGPRDEKNGTVSLRISNEETVVKVEEIEDFLTT